MGQTQSGEWSRRDAMRLELLRAKAMNQADSTFKTDSLMLQVADYYQRKGSPNDRMLSLYLLGCTYRDMGAAPRAIETWQKAVDEADTTRADCDLSTLMRIHSQMNELYTRMRLPDLAKGEIEDAEAICWKMKDTLNALIFEEKKCGLLFTEGQYEDCIKATERVYNLFLLCGYRDDAALCLYNCIKSCLTLGNYLEAKRYLDLYKSCSFFSTDQRKVNGGLGQPLIYEGQFYLGIGMTDSAEYYFRKALPYKNKRTNSLFIFKGLYQVYSMTNKPDSALKYMSLYTNAKEKDFYNATTQATISAKALYDYNVEQREAKNQGEKAEKRKTWILNSVWGVVLIISVFFMYDMQRRKRYLLLKSEYEKAKEQLIVSTKKLADSRRRQTLLKKKQEKDEALGIKEMETLKEENQKLDINIRNQEAINQKLQAKLEFLSTELNKAKTGVVGLQLERSEIVIYLNNYLSHITPGGTVPEERWQELEDTINRIYPSFYCRMHQNHTINKDHYRVCMLTLVGINSSGINTLLGKGASYASTIKIRLNQNVFGEKGKAEDFEKNIRNLI